VLGTLYANVASMLPHGDLSAAVASWPAASFIIATFILERWLRSGVSVTRPDAAPVTTVGQVPDHPRPDQPAAALNGSGWSRPTTSDWK
jgi:hypothetical protein